jgi:hypothetical protein
MSKDKGSKNHKKAPADKTSGKGKPTSDYKSEGKSKEPNTTAFNPKPDTKGDKPKKS